MSREDEVRADRIRDLKDEIAKLERDILDMTALDDGNLDDALCRLHDLKDELRDLEELEEK